MSWLPPKLVTCDVGPNYQIGDGWLAWRSRVGWVGQKRERQARENSYEWFRKYLQANSEQELFFTDNGRTALYTLLKTLPIELDSEVLIQTYSCVVLPNAVWQAGHKPVLVDIEGDPESPNLYNFDLEKLEASIGVKTRVLVVQYTFGQVPDMAEIIKLCHRYNLLLIEDCAHSLGGEIDLQGEKYPVGSLGHASIFSFGRDKIVSTTTGGMGTINLNTPVTQAVPTYTPEFLREWQDRAKGEYEQLSEPSSKFSNQALNYAWLTSWWIRPWYYWLLGKVVAVLAKKLAWTGRIYNSAERRGTAKPQHPCKYPERLFPLLDKQLSKLEKMNQHRRQLARIYSSGMSQIESEKIWVYPRFNGSSVWMRWTLVVASSETRARLYKNLKKRGVILGNWYEGLFMQPNLKLAKRTNYEPGKFPVAEKYSEYRSVNLPTNIQVSQREAQKIVEYVREGVS